MVEAAKEPTLNRASKLGFLAAWLGWGFDGLDAFLYTLVALPFVTELLGPNAAKGEAIQKAALIQGVFLFGWALGGAVFGRIGDVLGRTKTLTLTILTYAIFTGAAYFAHSWQELMLYRFLAALGIGGEWAAGSALVAETIPAKYKHWASALLQTGYMVGIILAALTVGALGAVPRNVFLVGILPALLTIFIRRAVPEPEAWASEKKKIALPPISSLFKGELKRTTVYVLLLTSFTLTTIWALLYFGTQVVQGLPEFKALAKPEQAATVRNVTIIYSLWNIAGNFFAAFVASKFGYRKSFALMIFLAMITFIVGFRGISSLGEAQFWLNAAMFFGAGLFALFPLYIPPLFPTLVRTTGSGFCYNVGRAVAGVGTFFGGQIAATAGGPAAAIYMVGFLYIPALIVAFLTPEHAEVPV
jgi:MFS family permease